MGVMGKILGIGIDQVGAELQQGRTKRLMAEQVGNQKELNEHSQQLNKEMWDYTNYENQVKHMENAGLNVGLMYGSSGGSGGTTGNIGGSASAGQAPDNKSVQAMGIGLQAEALESQIELNKANALKARTDAGKATEETTTVLKSRDLLIENMKQQGISTMQDNAIKAWLYSDEDKKEGEVYNETYDYHTGIGNNSAGAKGITLALFKTEAETRNLDANALLTNAKALGYWQELLNATKNSDSNAINAAANKLSAEWQTGEFTNWKTWADMGMKAVQTAGSLIKGGTKINKQSTYNQNGNRYNVTPQD